MPSSQNSKRQKSRVRTANELTHYFTHLQQCDPKEFKDKWQKLAHVPFSTEQLRKILYNTAQKVKDPSIPNDQTGAILSYIRQHFDIWFDQMVKQIDKASPQDMANSAWVIAAFDSLYRYESLDQYYHIFRFFIDEEKITDPRHQKQIHDADRWFFGQSNIPNIGIEERNAVDTKSKDEIRVRNKLNGLDDIVVVKTTEPVIVESPKAIDFVTIWKNKTEILNEFDGNSHFLNAKTARNSAELAYNLNTFFRSADIQRQAPDKIILRTDYRMGMNLKKNPETFYPQICKAVAKKGPGVWRTTDDPNRVIRLVHPARAYNN